MKPGRGPHVRIGVLASFTLSLGTRFSSSLNGGGDGIRLGGSGAQGPRLPHPLPGFCTDAAGRLPQ